MLPQARLEKILKGKNHSDALKSMKKHGHTNECWGIYDGVLVIYDEDDPPAWLAKVFEKADENGNTPDYKHVSNP